MGGVRPDMNSPGYGKAPDESGFCNVESLVPRAFKSMNTNQFDRRTQPVSRKSTAVALLFSPVLFVGLLMIITWVYMELGYPRITYFNPGITSNCSSGIRHTYISPDISMGANSRDNMLRIADLIYQVRWDWEIPIGSIDLYSNLSTDGLDYGGVYVMGPGLGFKYSAPNCQEFWNNKRIVIIDNR